MSASASRVADTSMLPAPEITRCQRWFSHRSFYRPTQEPIVVSEFGVEPLGPKEAKAFVVEHHYSGSFPYNVQSYALMRKISPFERARLVGVATFSTPSNPGTVRRWCGLGNESGLELGRFVLLPEVQGNGETWFLARALRALKTARPFVKCIVSYSDPHPRRNAFGHVTFPGHTGGVYSAANALYCGRASPRTLFLNHDGRALANRVLSKIRNQERGWRNAEQILGEFTGLCREDAESPEFFVERALASLRRERHAGNHTYIFPLASNRREKAAILNLPTLRARAAASGPYPKLTDSLGA